MEVGGKLEEVVACGGRKGLKKKEKGKEIKWEDIFLEEKMKIMEVADSRV